MTGCRQREHRQCRIVAMAISRYRSDKPQYRSDYYRLGEATDADADATMTVRDEHR